MSIRANSLRMMVMDTLFYTGIMSLAAASWTAVANGAEPRIVRVADAASEIRPPSDHVDSRLNTDDNLPSGIPEESAAAKREAMMLGMKLLERSAGQIEVVDVAAASPAWNAGIRRGDWVREIDGVKPKSLAGWVEDMGKVLKNTEDGKSVAAEFARDGEPLEVRITLPVSNVAAARDARKEQEEMARLQAREQRQLRRGQAGGPSRFGIVDRTDYGPDYAPGYGGWGFGGFFDDSASAANDPNGSDRMASSAVAQLMAVDPAAFPGGGGGQVGMAGFQDNAQGVDAMVVVRGLPQGTYEVGVGAGGNFGMTGGDIGVNGNPGFVGPDVGADGQFGLNPALQGTAEGFDRDGANANGGPANAQNPGGNQLPIQQQPTQQQPGFVPPGNAAPGAGGTPGANGRAGAGDGGAAPTGGDGASLANPSNAVLAQQLDAAPTNPAAGRPAVNPTRRNPQQPVQLSPNSDQRNHGTSAPGANPYDPRARSEAQRRMQTNDPLNNSDSAPGFASLGTLHVGPDGSGQVRNRLEGMSVRNLGGMQVFVRSNNFAGAANPGNSAAAAGNRANQTGSEQTGSEQTGSDRAVQRRVPAGQGELGQPEQQPGFSLPGNMPARGGEGIIAVGTIQLRDSGSMGSANPQTGERPRDEATQREQGRSQISDPTQQFNPSNPAR